jgi:hypothetical protein
MGLIKIKVDNFKPANWSNQWPVILLFVAYVLMLILGLAYVGGFIFKFFLFFLTFRFVNDAAVNRILQTSNVLGFANSIAYVITAVIGIISILVPIAIVQIFLSGAVRKNYFSHFLRLLYFVISILCLKL